MPGISQAIHTYDILNIFKSIVVFLFTYFKTFIKENISCPNAKTVPVLYGQYPRVMKYGKDLFRHKCTYNFHI